MPFTPEQMAAINASTKPAEIASNAGNFNPIDWTSSFVRAGAEDALNLFGVDKSPQTISFEKNNPLAGFAADFIGVGVPYAGWYKATKNVRRFEELLGGVQGAFQEGSIVGHAAREAARFTPLEAARLMSTAVVNPQRLPEEGFNSALNLTVAGGFGALEGVGAAYGSISRKIKDLAPNVDLNDPITLQFRTLRDAVGGGKVAPERLDEAKLWLNRYDRAVRTEVPHDESRYVSELYSNNPDAHTLGVGETGTERQSSALNSLFKPKQSSGLAVRRLLVAGENTPEDALMNFGFKDQAGVDARLSALPEGSLSRMQFPRAIEVKNEGGAGAGYVKNVLQKNMTQVGQDMYMTREANGLYVMVKKIKTGGRRTVVALQQTRGGKRQFHGTSTPIEGGLTDYYGSGQSIYGNGLYTTDALDVGLGYAKKGSGKKPTIYDVETQNNPKLFDLHQPVPESIKALAQHDQLLATALEDNPQSMKELMDGIRGWSRTQGVSTSGVQDLFDMLSGQLEKEGYNGYSHIGGGNTGTAPHQVNIFWTPEKHVITKEVPPRDFWQGVGKGDEFIIFKTDDPGFFGARQKAWMDRQVTKSMWFGKNAPENLPYQDGTNGSFMQGMMETIPLRNWFDDLGRAKDDASFVNRVAGKLGVNKDEQLNNAMRGILGFTKEHFSPTLWQLSGKDGILARWLYGITRSSYDRANWIADTMVYGTPRAQEGKSLARQLAFQGEHVGFGDQGPALSELVNGKLSTKDKQDLLQIQGGAWDTATIEQRYLAGDLSDNLHSLLQRLSKLEKTQFGELNDAELKAGLSQSTMKDAHFMLSHMWDGDWRVRIRDEDGKVVYMVGAANRGTATKQAAAIIKNAGKEKEWKFNDSAQETDDVFTKNSRNQLDDMDLLKTLNVQSQSFRQASAAMEKTLKESFRPGTLKQQVGVRGYSTNMDDAAILERLHKHVQQLQTHITNLNTNTLLKGKLMQLADQNPGLHRQLAERIQNMQGRAGMFSDWQNTVLDRGLAPWLGANSATKIVRTLNTVQHNLMLGMGNLAYPLINMMQFVQTTLPQIAYLGTVPLEKAGQYYNSILIHGTDGLARRPMSWMDPVKLAYQGFRIMGKPTPEDQKLFSKAIEEGVFSQKAVEEHVGVDAQFKQRLAGALGEKGGFTKFIQHISEWLPANSEKFSRLHSFTTGIAVGKDLLGMEGDNLYRFAKEFTHNTMFGYNMVDRAKIITGPLGSFAGLYKNWLMHYLGWFATYSGEALRGNFAPLVWSNLGTMGMSGAGGTAAYGVVDGLSRMFGNGPAFNSIYSMFGDEGKPDLKSDAMFYGLPALFNVSLQGGSSAFGANPAKDAASLFSLVQLERGMALGKAIGNAAETSSATGQSPFADPLVRDQLIAALSPRAIARSAQVVQGNFLKSLQTGNPLVKGLSPAERFMYGLGFNTPGIDRMYRVSEELYNNEEHRRTAMRAFARQMIEMQDAGAYRELTELSRRVIASGVGLDSVLRSAQYMRERGTKDLLQFRTNKQNRSVASQFAEPVVQ